MKNLHILKTSYSSKIGRFIDTQKITLRSSTDIPRGENVNIYITSDEKIKEGDWFMSDFNSFPIHNIKDLSEREGSLGWKQKDLKNNLKIILTTDQDLIKDGVQAIDDEFLKWFVKNPSCEEIQTIRVSTWCNGGKVCVCNVPKFCNEKRNDFKYIIIIPTDEYKQESVFENAKSSLKKYLFDNKEKVAKDLEQMRGWSNTDKKETIEEVSERILANNIDGLRDALKDDDLFYFYKGVIQSYGEAMAKWQQERMYSEEEVMDMFHNLSTHLPLHYEFLVKEQFKKK